MKKGMAFLGKGWVFIMGVSLLALSCGSMYQAPFGSKVSTPSNTTVSSTVDVSVIFKAIVVDKDNNPLNDVDVDFTVCCDGAELGDEDGGSLGTATTIRTDGSGVATVYVLVFGDYDGTIVVTADIGVASGKTEITKSLP